MTTYAPHSVRNTRVALTVAFLEDFSFILPIWMLFGIHELGLTTTVTTILFMCIWLTSGLLEIPTGALADRLGRKPVFLIGVGLMSLYPLAYAFTLPVILIAVISLVAGVGSAMRSGTLIPMVHETFKHEGRSEKQYHTFLSNAQVLTFMARILSGIAGGLLYVKDPRLPYVAIFVVYVALFVVGLFAVETPRLRSTVSNNAHITKTLQLIRRTPLIMYAFFAYITSQLLGEAMWTAFQPFYSEDGHGVQTIGFLFSVIAGLSAISAYGIRHLMRRRGVLHLQLCVSALMLAGVLLLNAPATDVRLLAIVPAAMAFGISVTPIKAVVQKMIDSTYHSTALSVISVLQYVVYATASLYVSGLIDWLGNTRTRHVLLAFGVIATLLVAWIYTANRRADPVITET